MSKLLSPSSRTAAVAAMGTGVAMAIGGILQLTDEQSGETTTVGVAEHLILAALTVTALALVPVVLHLGRLAGRTRLARAAAVGLTALGALCVVSNVRGEDPSFFAAVAVPSNLLIVVGLAGLAVALHRQGAVPRGLAIAIGLSWILALPMSAIGGGIVAGAIWLVVGWMLRHGELPRRAGTAHAAPAAL